MNKSLYLYIFLVIFLLGYFKCKEDTNKVCQRFQEYSERCESELLNLIKESQGKYDESINKSEKADFDYKLIEYRIQNRISRKDGYKQCINLSRSDKPADKARISTIRDCIEKKDCREFIKCIINM